MGLRGGMSYKDQMVYSTCFRLPCMILLPVGIPPSEYAVVRGRIKAVIRLVRNRVNMINPMISKARKRE